MGRVPWQTRRLDRNHACQRPSHFVFVDTETTWEAPARLGGKRLNKLRCGVACGVDWPQGRKPKEEWIEFTNADAFWKWLEGKQHEKKSLWVVAHNMVYDFTILGGWNKLEATEYRIKTDCKTYIDPRTGKERQGKQWEGLVAIDGFPFHIETQGTIGRVNFSDLMNYYRSSLGEVASTVGLEKLPMPADTATNAEWLIYCRRDVKVLKRAYLALVEQWQREDNGNWALSGPALAWNHYRHKHMATGVVLHSHAEARDLEWKSYYPGECRAWFRGDCPGPVVHYDVNSLYPSVMLGRDYPTELIDYFLTPKPGIFESLLNRYLCVAEVDLDTTDDSYPFRSAGRVLYPVGRFTTALAGPELVRSWTAGRVRAVRRLAYYKGARLFDTYVADWWGRKRAAGERGDTAAEKFCKLILNSLYGKFAQRNPSWQSDPRVKVVRPWRAFPWTDPETGTVRNARGIGWLGQFAGERKDSAHCFPAVAAFVTAYAREKMRAIRKQLPPSECYYQDTDSLFVGERGADELGREGYTVGADLGDIRVVNRYTRLSIRGPKNYTADGRHTIAGVKSKDIEVAPGSFTGTRFEGGGQVVTREPDGTVLSWQVDYEMPGSCLEGGYGSDGWYFPIHID